MDNDWKCALHSNSIYSRTCEYKTMEKTNSWMHSFVILWHLPVFFTYLVLKFSLIKLRQRQRTGGWSKRVAILSAVYKRSENADTMTAYKEMASFKLVEEWNECDAWFIAPIEHCERNEKCHVTNIVMNESAHSTLQWTSCYFMIRWMISISILSHQSDGCFVEPLRVFCSFLYSSW